MLRLPPKAVIAMATTAIPLWEAEVAKRRAELLEQGRGYMTSYLFRKNVRRFTDEQIEAALDNVRFDTDRWDGELAALFGSMSGLRMTLEDAFSFVKLQQANRLLKMASVKDAVELVLTSGEVAALEGPQ